MSKIAIVTGANGNIGRALVERLEKECIDCVTVDLNGGVDFQADFTEIKTVEDACRRISMRIPTVDYLFNVAGIGTYKSIDELGVGEFVDSLNINLISPFIMTKRLLHLMRKGSVVLNIGSGMGVNPTAFRSAYCTSKFGLRGLSLSLAEELKDIDVCLLTLGSVMDSFGTGGLEKRKELEKQGKHYLTVSQVIQEIMDIINDGYKKPYIRKKEYPFYAL